MLPTCRATMTKMHCGQRAGGHATLSGAVDGARRHRSYRSECAFTVVAAHIGAFTAVAAHALCLAGLAAAHFLTGRGTLVSDPAYALRILVIRSLPLSSPRHPLPRILSSDSDGHFSAGLRSTACHRGVQSAPRDHKRCSVCFIN
ncbi:hypothetical protein ZWY2020_002374 [Hordeum vulgare]|nr:hypothetical protein ZWY2020_002374 [Hordeum vulgare]